jgi:nonribosomal peptide synthetase DhbF
MGLAGVDQAVVVAHGNGVDRRLVAYVVAETEDAATLRQNLAAVVPDHLVPSVFMMLDSLPVNLNGKVDRAALPDPATDEPLG